MNGSSSTTSGLPTGGFMESSPSPSGDDLRYSAPFSSGATMLPRGNSSQHQATTATYGSQQPVAGGFSPRTMDQFAPMSASNGYLGDGSQAWPTYGSNGFVATVNGALGGPGRQRAVNRRSQLPPTWTDMPSSFSPSFSPAIGGASTAGSSMMGNASVRHHHHHHQAPAGDEQLIPTAIVIKNIPFAVRKETLADIMVQLRLPTPYAFNYHFDHGVFRGLAFANFSSAEDTRLVIETMDGLEIANRKLRVEYKKMLPEAERERIEREKRERRGQLEEQHRGPMLHSQASIQSLASTSASQAGGSGGGGGGGGGGSGVGSGGSGVGSGSRPPTMRAPYSSTAAPWGSIEPPRTFHDLDLNDAETLDFYTQLMLFKTDVDREIYIFPATVSPTSRRIIHIIAQHLGLPHESVGHGESRQVHVSKLHMGRSATSSSSVAMDPTRARPLNRAATFDFADQNTRAVSHNYGFNGVGLSNTGRHHLYLPHHLHHGPTLEVPGSPDTPSMPNSLRAAKSFTDLRSFSPTASQSSATYVPSSANVAPATNHSTGNSGASGIGMMGASTPTSAGFGGYGPVSPGSGSVVVTPNLTSAASANDLYSQFGGLNLTDSGSSAAASSSNNPGTIGSQRPGQSRNAPPERQPRGPSQEGQTFRRGLSSIGQGE